MSLIDLRILKDRWNEDGAREVFEELVLHCVKTIDETARRIQPNPGDKGIDTFIGDFAGTIKVWQAKYFTDKTIGNAQQKQVREAWEQLQKATDIGKVTEWTLCIPIIMDLKGDTWWQNWKKKQEAAFTNCKLHLWNHSNFVAHYVNPKLMPIFDCALERGIKHKTQQELIAILTGKRPELVLEDLPNSQHFSTAQFVRKLELANVTQHAGARRSFYNFELLRSLVTQGGDTKELKELQDLLIRVQALWETEFHARVDDNHGRQFYAEVNRKIADEHEGQLSTTLPAGVLHKQGSLLYLADLCETGWTDNFKDVNKINKQKGVQ